MPREPDLQNAKLIGTLLSLGRRSKGVSLAISSAPPAVRKMAPIKGHM